MNLGNWQLDTLSGGTFALDGGVTFGVVPKSLWAPLLPPDDNNRVRLAANCLLARDGTHTVLIDTGYGDKLSPLDRRFYELEAGNPILASLAALGVEAEDVDLVVLSHMHWDHAGGATSKSGHRRVPTFPKARYLVGRDEWEDANSGTAELETAYPLENITPLAEADVVSLIDNGQEVVPGMVARQTGGHTRGHLAFEFAAGAERVLMIGDLCATSMHLHRMWNLSYDTYPMVSRRVKPQMLSEAADGGWWLVWPHDIRTVAGRVARDRKGGFEVVERRARL